MNKYLKDNVILGDSLENFFGWITLLCSEEAFDAMFEDFT